jgi:hypothetical protein
MANEGPQ